MSAEIPEPNPELFIPNRVRSDMQKTVLEAQKFYNCPLLNQAAVTINLALVENGIDVTPRTKDSQQALALSYEQEGIQICRYQNYSVLTDLIAITFPPQELLKRDSDRSLTITINRAFLGAGAETTTDIFGIETITNKEGPNLRRVVSGVMGQSRTEIMRTQIQQGVELSNPAAQPKTDSIHLNNPDIPPFDHANPNAFFDFIFAVPPQTK